MKTALSKYSLGRKLSLNIPCLRGGSVAEWLGRRTWNPEVAGSSPALTTKLELFLGGPQFNSSVILVNSQLACLPPVGIFKPVMFIWNICFLQFEWHACELACVAKCMTTINKHLTFFLTFCFHSNSCHPLLSFFCHDITNFNVLTRKCFGWIHLWTSCSLS